MSESSLSLYWPPGIHTRLWPSVCAELKKKFVMEQIEKFTQKKKKKIYCKQKYLTIHCVIISFSNVNKQNLK